MDNIRFQYTIEFTLPGGKPMRVTIEGNNPDDALNELFKSIRAKTVVHSVVKPDNDHNDIANLSNELLGIFKRKPKP